jgi:hypothetical protein
MQVLVLFKQWSNDGLEAEAKGVVHVVNDPLSYEVLSYGHFALRFQLLV